MKYIPIYVFIALALLSNSAFSADDKIVNMACGTFPPYKINNAERPGIDVEVMKAAWSAVGKKSSFQFFPWKRAVILTTNGSVDGLCGCSYRPEREQKFRFSDIMGHHSQGIFIKTKNKEISIKSVADLNGLSIATVRGYAIQKELDASGIKNVGVLDHKQLVSMLLNDRVDAVYAYRDVFYYNLNKLNSSSQIRYFELNSQPYYVCISRAIPNSKDITTNLNQGLRIIRYTGEYLKIWRSYLATN